MTESKMIDLSTVIGVLTFSWHTTSTRVTEEYRECTGELELGFCLGSLFVPFSEVMRFYGGG